MRIHLYFCPISQSFLHQLIFASFFPHQSIFSPSIIFCPSFIFLPISQFFCPSFIFCPISQFFASWDIFSPSIFLSHQSPFCPISQFFLHKVWLGYISSIRQELTLSAIILSQRPLSRHRCRFRQTLWQEVDLSEAGERLDALWSNTASLPTDQQEWEATRQLRIDVCHYRDLIPLLTRLHAKVSSPREREGKKKERGEGSRR